MAVVRDVAQRDEQPGLFVVVVVAQRPLHVRDRRVLLEPGALGLRRGERAIHGFRGAAVAERLVQAADAVVRRGDEHQVAGRPGVEIAVREHAGHPVARHLLHVVPADHLPLVREQRVEPGVVRAVADGVVVHEGHRLVQVVQDLRLPVHEGLEDVLRELERHPHRVAIVVVRHVVAPVREARRDFVGMLDVPVVEIDRAIAAVHFDDRRDQRDDVVADVLDVRALVDGEAIGQLHERGGCTRLGGMDRTRYVIDGRGGGGDPVSFRVVEVDGARIGEFRELRLVRVELRHQRLGRDGDGDHLAALFRRADREDAHARRRFREQPHVLVDLLRVRQLGRRAGDVAERDLGRRDRLRGREIVDERRQEELFRRVLVDLLRVFLVDRLRGDRGPVSRRRDRPGRALPGQELLRATGRARALI